MFVKMERELSLCSLLFVRRLLQTKIEISATLWWKNNLSQSSIEQIQFLPSLFKINCLWIYNSKNSWRREVEQRWAKFKQRSREKDDYYLNTWTLSREIFEQTRLHLHSFVSPNGVGVGWGLAKMGTKLNEMIRNEMKWNEISRWYDRKRSIKFCALILTRFPKA